MSKNNVINMPARESVEASASSMRRLQAYYVLGATNPALLAGGADFATVRATELDRIEAALHAAEQYGEMDAPGRAYVLAVMRQDADAARARQQNGGW